MPRLMDISTLITIVGTISAFGCFLIIVTYATFKEIRATEYAKLIFYVALNDCIASTGVALGSTKSGSAQCWYQGIVANYNYLSSVFWITFISYRFFRTIYLKQKRLVQSNNKTEATLKIKNANYTVLLDNMYVIHFLNWVFPAIVSALPLTTNTYGNSDDEEDTWCFISNTSYSPKWGAVFWTIMSFYIWVWLCIIINLVLLYRIYQLVYSNAAIKAEIVYHSEIKKTLRKLQFYPFILIVCWLSCTFIDVYHRNYNSTVTGSMDYTYRVFLSIAVSQGAFTSVVYFTFNPDVRQLWYDLLFCKKHKVSKVHSIRMLNNSTDSGSGDNSNNPKTAQLILEALQRNSSDSYGNGSFNLNISDTDIERAYFTTGDTDLPPLHTQSLHSTNNPILALQGIVNRNSDCEEDEDDVLVMSKSEGSQATSKTDHRHSTKKHNTTTRSSNLTVSSVSSTRFGSSSQQNVFNDSEDSEL